MFLGRVSLFIKATDAVERKIPVFWHSSTSHTLYLITVFTTAQRRRQLLHTVILTHPHLLPYPHLPYLDTQDEPSAHTGLAAKVKAPKAKSTFFFFFLSDRATHESGMTGTDLGAAPDREGLSPRCYQKGLPVPCGRGKEASTLLLLLILLFHHDI